MSIDFPNERPALGEIRVGDEVFVFAGHYGRKQPVPVLAHIAKIGRVWLDIDAASSRRTWRMRKDTQNEGSTYSHQARFLTAAQMEWWERLNDADTFLREQGIMTSISEHGWHKPSGRVRLADLIRADKS